MSNPYFKFKQFTISQDKSAMKVGVDGVLLGAWTQISDAKKILDIGTGTGLLSLMLAQKSQAKITAVELDKNAYIQAKENIEQSRWEKRIEIINSSIQKFAGNSTEKFDLIICNPPYFNDSLISENKQRNLARHDESLSISDLFICVKKLLNENGQFTMIYPFDRSSKLYTCAKEYGLYPGRVMEVKGTELKAPNRVVVEFCFSEQPIIKETLVVRDSMKNDYTLEYKNITREYYLAF